MVRCKRPRRSGAEVGAGGQASSRRHLRGQVSLFNSTSLVAAAAATAATSTVSSAAALVSSAAPAAASVATAAAALVAAAASVATLAAAVSAATLTAVSTASLAAVSATAAAGVASASVSAAATAAAVSTAATAPAAAATAATTVAPGLGFVHLDLLTVHAGAIHLLGGGGGLILPREGDEGVTLAGVVDVGHGPELVELGRDGVVGHVLVDAIDEQLAAVLCHYGGVWTLRSAAQQTDIQGLS